MDDTYAAALITQARNLAGAYRFDDAVKILGTSEFRRFADRSDHPDLVVVLSELAWWMAWGGHLAEAEGMYQQLESRITPDVPAQTRLTVGTRYAYVVGISGAQQSSERATQMLAELVTELDSATGVEPELRFHIRRQHARWIGTSGDWDRALELLRQLEREFDGTIPADSEEWLLLMSNLAYFAFRQAGRDRSESGMDEAIRRYEALVSARTSALGALHPHTLDARRNAAWAIGTSQPEVALVRDTALVEDWLQVVDAAHRYLMTTRLDIAVLASRLQQPDKVVGQVDQIMVAVNSAESAFDVLSEYGFVDAPKHKLEEVARYLRTCGDAGRVDDLLEVRDALGSEA